MIIRRKFGSVYVNDGDLQVGTWVEQTIKVNSLSIGPTKKGRSIQWILANGMLIADRCVLTGISWDELEANDLVFGNKKILLDDFAYQVRLLKVGRYEGEPNEWDDALGDIADESDAVWRWKYQGFWGQERNRLRTQCITRGYTSSRYYALCESRTKSPRIGWRPVLIPDVVQKIGSEEIGKKLQLWGKTGEIIFGRLVDITEYDFLLVDAIRVATSAPGVPCVSKRWRNKKAAMERSGLLLAQRYPFAN